MLNITPSGRISRPASHRDYKADLPVRIPRAKREKIEQAIEEHLAEVDTLVRVLDAHDKDANLEEDRSDYEFTTGGSFCQGGQTSKGKFMWLDDLEEDRADAEPSLAHTLDLNQAKAQRNLQADWGGADFEQEHDGREPQCEDEGAQCEDEGHDSDRELEGEDGRSNRKSSRVRNNGDAA